MTKSRDNHYVPQWYQRGFLEPDREKLAYLHLNPKMHQQSDGSLKPGRTRFDSYTSQCFHKNDLYTTSYFGFDVNDEIERKLFGGIDGKGPKALEAFRADDLEARIEEFENFFEVMDAQKLRTPKGLEWLRRHYPSLDQNELMMEMQGVRMMHCTLWSECVREIVSAEDAGVKFIISDHPVTVYNHAVQPNDPRCAFPEDPQISWKATQTIFPLDRDSCLILTNLEYARDPQLNDPCRKRTNARSFGNSLINAEAFIRSRKLSDAEVIRINHVIKSRANEHIAAGRREWLHPETEVDTDWKGIQETLLPPSDQLFSFGGEIYIGYESGDVDYQDQFGRSDPRPPILDRPAAELPQSKKDFCGCGSPHSYRDCCLSRPVDLRPSWSERGIRERNILHAQAILNITGLAEHRDWHRAREELTDDKIAKIYEAFAGLWPRDTDLISLLPKPDGRLRSLFTGLIDPRMITEFAIGAPNYFGEILIQNPFVHARCLQPKSNPTKNPAAFRQQVLKDVALLLDMMPLIDAGIVTLFPDPCVFDPHLRSEMWQMAQERTKLQPKPVADIRSRWLLEDDFYYSIFSASEERQRSMLRRSSPDLPPEDVDRMVEAIRLDRGLDPLASLRSGDAGSVIPDGGLLMLLHMAPNLELSLYLAQATGSIIVTDSPHRWKELRGMSRQLPGEPPQLVPEFRTAVQGAVHNFLGSQEAVERAHATGASQAYRSLVHDIVRHLTAKDRKPKPNWASQLKGRFARAHAGMGAEIRKHGAPSLPARIECIAPSGGIRDNTINRLLLMSNVDHHADHVPMAFFIQRPDPTFYRRSHFEILRRD